ncbi:hypothetical protein NP493_1744g00006 [Ridgeia piscesae]|uniref:Uncharacterized protein n=1 Tax=Ridgeia piscesae TaxID=27915 RepID=A0AAD9JTR7_RIDPI|nr:hypothetical protein NP493_1744g00006 [Ridgeia piscesae]
MQPATRAYDKSEVEIPSSSGRYSPSQRNVELNPLLGQLVTKDNGADGSTQYHLNHDTALYLTTMSQDDATTLQTGLDMMAKCESECAMQFRPLKCSVLSLSRSHPKQYQYKPHGHVHQHTTSVKYLDVTI